MSTAIAADIIKYVGGPQNIVSLTHCATRLRFQLHDASKVDAAALDALPEVMGTVPQSGDRFQVVIGGTVQSVYEQITQLPQMSNLGAKTMSDADVKAAARAKGPRGKIAWIDNFFEYLSDSFRPIIGALIGASLFITFMSLMATIGVIGNWADPRVPLDASWQFVNICWQSVFVFLPLMVAYNASKKVGADPWVGFAIMAVLLLPGFAAIGKDAMKMQFAGAEIDVVHIFGLPLTIFNYSSQVFPPLLMAAILGLLTKGLKKIIPANVQLIFVPFLSLLIMIPLTAFLIGPIGVYAGAGIASGIRAINDISPFIFAIVIPLAYPFMVPLGIHWPINAIMLLNIQTLGYDFIQGPMGAWNFACFGATAGVLILAIREKNTLMRQTATGALAAGLLGGISEPSLYGIHLRFKRIYPRMLVGCVAGGIVIGIGGGVTTKAFVFTSLLTIPAFSNIPLYGAGVAVAFFVSMFLVLFSGYQNPAEKAAMAEKTSQANALDNGSSANENNISADQAATDNLVRETETDCACEADDATSSCDTSRSASIDGTPGALAVKSKTRIHQILSPLAGEVLPLSEVPDPVFASGTVGQGIAIKPGTNQVVSPADATVIVAPASGHAFGLALDNGVEMLIHVGIDTVNLGGEGFKVQVTQGQKVKAGDVLVEFDPALIQAAGYSLITPVLVTNAPLYDQVVQAASGEVQPLDVVILAVNN